MNFLNIFKRKCSHDPDMFIKIEDSVLHEPNGEPRKVKIRMCIIQCLKCKQILKLSPLGIVHDPVNPDEKEDHAVLTHDEKKQLLKEISVNVLY